MNSIDTFCDETWEKVKCSLSKFFVIIIDNKHVPNDICQIMDLYNIMYDYLNGPQNNKRYAKEHNIRARITFAKKIKGWINTEFGQLHIHKINDIIGEKNSESFCKKLTQFYCVYQKFIRICNIVFKPLMGKKSPGNNHLDNDYITIIFKKSFIENEYHKIKNIINDHMLHLIKNIREHRTNFFVGKGMIEFFLELDNFLEQQKESSCIYIDCFENIYINEMVRYLSSNIEFNTTNLINNNMFVKHVIHLINDELSIIEKVTDMSHNIINEQINQILIYNRSNIIVSEFKVILNKNGFDYVDDNKAFYHDVNYLITRSNDKMLFEEIAKIIIAYVSEQSENINNSYTQIPNQPEKYLIQSYCDLIDGSYNFVKLFFENKQLLQQHLNNYFKEITKQKIRRQIKENEYKDVCITEQLVLFCDSFLKKEFKDINDSSDHEFEFINKISRLLYFLPDKDIYIELYKSNQIRRMVAGNYNSDLEKELLEKLKKEHGNMFTKSCEDVIHSIEQSREIGEQFNVSPMSNGISYQLKCHILSCNLIFDAGSAITLDPSIQTSLDNYSKYYQTKFQSKIISWIPSMSTSIIDIDFPKGKKEIMMTLVQLNIIKTINDQKKLSLKDLLEKTSTDIKTFKIQISPLYLSKIYNLLLRTDENGNCINNQIPLNLTDQLSLNTNYISKHKKLTIVNLIRQVIEKKDIGNKIEEGRKYAIDACIVRIMKSRKILNYVDLQMSVIGQLHKLFVPQPKQIKICIEGLIDKEYLKRSDAESSKLEYLA